MPLSKQSVGTLIDLVENKMTSMQILDREDQQELNILSHCLGELTRLLEGAAEKLEASVATVPRRGRRKRLQGYSTPSTGFTRPLRAEQSEETQPPTSL